MRCAYYQKKKQSRMTNADQRRLNEVVNDFMLKAMTDGTEKALESIKEEEVQSNG